MSLVPVHVIVRQWWHFPTDVKYEVLSLGCHDGDLECVKMMTNKYDCDLKGLAYTIPPHTCTCMILVVICRNQ